MASNHVEIVIFAFLICTGMVVGIFSDLVKYTDPAIQDKMALLNSNMEYLYDVVIRQDRLLRIVYYGFFIAIFCLGHFLGRLEQRVSQLEASANDGKLNWEDLLRRIQRFENNDVDDLRRIAAVEESLIAEHQRIAILQRDVNFLLEYERGQEQPPPYPDDRQGRF
jgi:uncharacterized protein involved in cysteine biosynthesis